MTASSNRRNFHPQEIIDVADSDYVVNSKEAVHQHVTYGIVSTIVTPAVLPCCRGCSLYVGQGHR